MRKWASFFSGSPVSCFDEDLPLQSLLNFITLLIEFFAIINFHLSVSQDYTTVLLLLFPQFNVPLCLSLVHFLCPYFPQSFSFPCQHSYSLICCVFFLFLFLLPFSFHDSHVDTSVPCLFSFSICVLFIKCSVTFSCFFVSLSIHSLVRSLSLPSFRLYLFIL